MCVCVSVSLRSGPANQLIDNSSKTVKATDFKFDTRVPRDSPDKTPKNILLLTDKVTKMLLNYYSVKIHLAEICTLMSAF